MTKREHIEYWLNTAEEDWKTAETLYIAKRYLHCLFWSHLVLEKIAKAHWVKNHDENIPPKVHNVVWLLNESNVDMDEEAMNFLYQFNDFQLSTRYPDYLNNIYAICTETFTSEKLEKVKEIRKCLLNKL